MMESNPNVAVNLGTLFDDAVALDPDRVALINGETGETVTYGQLHNHVARAGNALQALGVERGDRVALLFPNELTYLSLFFGAARAGAVTVPVNIQSPTNTVAYVMDDSGADLAVSSADPEVLETAREAIAASEIEQLAVAATDPDAALDGPVDADVTSFTTAHEAADSDLPPANVSGDDPAFQPYTSGSTGRPKGVIISHGGAVWNARTIRQIHYFDREERSLVAVPLYHKNAMAGAVKPILDAGGSVIVLDGFDPEKVIKTIDRYEITYMTGVPAMYEMLVDSATLTEHDVSSLTWCVCGSDAVPESLHERFGAAFGAEMLESYGLTEGGPVVTASPRWGVRKVGSAGITLPDVETQVVNPETGTELSAGETGELLVSNPGVGTYYEQPDAAAEAFEQRDGCEFLHTGDLARIDEQGYHYLVGRLDDMLIVGGENVYPAEVEDLISKFDGAEKVVVVGAPHSVKGEAPVAFVVGNGLDEERVKEFALTKGPAYAHPRRVFFVDEFPLTGAGKIDRDALETRARKLIDGPL